VLSTGTAGNSYSNTCLIKAFEIIKKNYAPGSEILSYTGLPGIISSLVECENNKMLYYSLPNFMHEMVHFAGFKIMGIGINRIKVEITDMAKIYSARSYNNLHDEGFFISGNRQIIIRGIRLPQRKIIYNHIPAHFLDNPNFRIYLTGKEAESGYLTLLDELNSYTHELQLVTALYPKTIPPGKTTIQKDNIAAIQFMILAYLYHVRKRMPRTYSLMKKNKNILYLTKHFYIKAEKAIAAVENESKFKKIRFAWPAVYRAVKNNRIEFIKFISSKQLLQINQ
ncbi:hypothetical protein ACFL20_03020, partial [Spirochaetota bacterium]